MDAQEIVQKLKVTPYKFTFAHQVRDQVKRMNDDESDFLRLELRRQMAHPDNKDIYRPLTEILN